MAAPLSRTWFDALIDDSGDGVSGTVWNKAQIDGLLDTVDASLAGVVDRTGTPAAAQLAMFSDVDTVTGAPGLIADAANGGVTLTGPLPFVDLIDQALAAGARRIRIAHTTDVLVIAADVAGVPTTLATLNKSGRLFVPAITLGDGQIKFPATPVPSADVTTFDDYREGIWTPVIGGGGAFSGQTYSTQAGTWTKCGREVTCYGNLVLTNKGTFAPSNLFIFNLPYPCTSMPGVLSFGAFTNFATGVASLLGEVVAGAVYAVIRYVPAAGGTLALGLPDTMLQNNTSMSFRVAYQTAL